MKAYDTKNLSEKAQKLEVLLATKNLFAYLFPDIKHEEKLLGRYRLFGQSIEQHPQLLHALLDKHSKQIMQEWLRVLKTYQSDARFLHTLALLYSEAALNKHAQAKPAEREWEIGTALFMLLLSSEMFWEYFSEKRWHTELGERRDLDRQQQEYLLYATVDNILMVHSTYGKQHFTAGEHILARAYVHSLDMCCTGEKLHAALQKHSIPYGLTDNPDKLSIICTQANKILNEWCTSLVNQAEQETNDADAIKALPQGIRKNYAGGIKVLEPFVALNVPNTRVLQTGLDWYNDWCYDIYVLKDTEQLEYTVKMAALFADQLIPLCVKSQAYTQENQVISQYYLLRGFVLTNADKPQPALKEFEEALIWNPTNINAKHLFEDTKAEIFLDPATEYAKRKEFDKAYKLLDEAEQKIADQKVVHARRAFICFLHAEHLAENGKFREALKYAKQADQLNPNEEVIQTFIAVMEELAPEEETLRLLKLASEAFEKDQYDGVIQYTSRVPQSSKRHNDAQKLQAVAYFQRGIAAANSKNFHKAEQDLRYALKICDDADIHKQITQQLSVLLNMYANEIARALKNDPSAGRNDLIKIKHLLEEATKLDPMNTSAKENLKALNGVLQ